MCQGVIKKWWVMGQFHMINFPLFGYGGSVGDIVWFGLLWDMRRVVKTTLPGIRNYGQQQYSQKLIISKANCNNVSIKHRLEVGLGRHKLATLQEIYLVGVNEPGSCLNLLWLARNHLGSSITLSRFYK